MLVSFTIENWMSYRDPATLSMVASRERQHGIRVPKVAKYNIRVLPVASIYGANASGKSNLFAALNFARMLIVKGTQPESFIAVEPFRLDPKCIDLPSRFTFELLIDEIIYEYSFSVTRKSVFEERLVEISSASERILFHRKDGKPNLHKELDKDDFLHYAFKGTRDNQLFITNAVSQKVTNFKPIYDWFQTTLELIAPDSRFELFEQFLQENHPLFSVMNSTLAQLDTGIEHLGGEDIPFGNLPIPEAFRLKLQEEIKEGVTVRIFSEPERFIITRLNGELVAKKLITFHNDVSGKEVKFDMNQESDGSRRLIDLLPSFLDIRSGVSKKVYIFDELDRSLHTLITRQLLSCYLNSCSQETRSQMLFTTHDVLLMDQELFRRDEMWITERNDLGCSTILSFSDYKDIRYDKDIRKSYLQGRIGGVPRILLSEALFCGNNSD